MKKYCKDNKERFSKNKRNWYVKNKQWSKEYHNNYIKENPILYKEYNKNRRNKNHKISKQEWESCKQYFNNSCAYCGMIEKEHRELYNQDLHKEHIIWDGRNDIKNCVPSCKICNSEKNMFTLNNWYNINNPKYLYDRYFKIYLWIRYDCKKHIK